MRESLENMAGTQLGSCLVCIFERMGSRASRVRFFVCFIACDNKLITIFLPIDLPVLIEPVVNLGLSVEGVAEVGRPGGGNPELLLVGAEDVVDQLLVLSLVVVLNNAEVSCSSA